MSLVDASARFPESDDMRRTMLLQMTPTQRDGLERWQITEPTGVQLAAIDAWLGRKLADWI